MHRDSTDNNPKTSAAIGPDWPPAQFDPWRPATPTAETPLPAPPQA
jgi:hypothetical protein